MRIEHLHIQHRIDADLDVVARDADLLGHVDRLFLQAVTVGDPLDERNQDMESGLQGAVVLAEALDHIRALLRNHRSGAPHCDHYNDGDDDEDV